MTEIQELATAKWLTKALRKSGLLNQGRVETVELSPLRLTTFSTPKVASLEIEYSEKDVSAQPNLVFKIANGIKEHIFFSEIAPLMQISEVIKCYHAEYDFDEQQAYLLLEDVTSTHFQTTWPIPPEEAHCYEVIDCLAKIHSYWWEHPRLKGDLLQKCNQGNIWKDRIELAVSRISEFFDFIGDRLSKERKQKYERVLSSNDQIWRPRQAENGATLLHGDAHFWNILYPCDNATGQVRVIDWNSWDIGRATDDLAYMIGLHWYPARRREYEKQLLQRYCTQMQERDVAITWDELWQDYRKSVIMNLFIPVWQWCTGINSSVWWAHLERSFMAYDDLDCASIS